MGVIKARAVAGALNSKGFSEHQKRDHLYFFFHHNGKKSNIYTKVSHGAGDIGPHLCSQMAKQIKLTGTQFRELVDCRLGADEYLSILIDNHHLSA